MNWMGKSFSEWSAMLLGAFAPAKTERDQLIKDEGIKLTLYYCSAGKLTIGIGRNLDGNPLTSEEAYLMLLSRPQIDLPPNSTLQQIRQALTMEFGQTGITKEEAYFLLDNDIAKVKRELTWQLKWFSDAPIEVQNILINMGFQMGVPGLMKFKQTLYFIENKFYRDAGENLTKTLWYKQTPQRAKRLIERLKKIV